MYRLTERRQNVTVMTLSTLRKHLETVSGTTCRLSIHHVHRDRVSIRAEYLSPDKKKHSDVVLPAYPTGLPDDAPSNNLNVVLDPLGFENIDSSEEREIFAPLLGHEILAYYERMHPDSGLSVSRCC